MGKRTKRAPAPASKQMTQDECLEWLTNAYEFSQWHAEPWKNEVAADLNQLMGRAVWWMETCGDESDILFGNAVIRTVQRVSEFEELERTQNPCKAIPT